MITASRWRRSARLHCGHATIMLVIRVVRSISLSLPSKSFFHTVVVFRPYCGLFQAGSFPATPSLHYCVCNVGQLCVSPRRRPRSAFASPLAERLPVPDLLPPASRLRVRPPPSYDGLSENNLLYALSIALDLYSVKRKTQGDANYFCPSIINRLHGIAALAMAPWLARLRGNLYICSQEVLNGL